VRRQEFIAPFGAKAECRLKARAQRADQMRRIGYLRLSLPQSLIHQQAMLMRCYLKAILTLSILLLMQPCHVGNSQEASRYEYAKQISPLFQKGSYEEAEALAERYSAETRTEFGESSTEHVAALTWLAAIAQDRGQYDKAETIYKTILTTDEARLGPSHANVGRDCNNIGLLYQELGRYGVAEGYYNRALTITEAALGPNHPTLAKFMHSKAALLRLQGRYTESEQLFKKALTIYDSQATDDPNEIGRTLSNLGRLYQDMSRYKDAEATHKRALSIFEKNFGADSIRSAYSLHDLAALYQALGQSELAEQYVNRAILIRTKLLTNEHVEVARSLYILAAIQETQGKIADAIANYRRAMAIQEKLLGSSHPDLAMTMAGLAVAYRSAHRDADAKALLEGALAIQEKSLGPNHPNLATTLLPLADIYRSEGRRDDAERLLARARAIRKASLTEVKVLFATNRKREATGTAVHFSTEGNQRLEVGSATVAVIKPEHQEIARAQAEEPRKGGIAEAITDLRRLSVPLLDLSTSGELIEQAKLVLAASKVYKGQALIFVHGYNVDFENAVRRAGQIAYDLNFDGPVFAFSWPSQECLLCYLTDRDTVDIAAEQLKHFLLQIVAPIDARKVHIIAHSMGNLVLLKALGELMDVPASNRPRIGEVIDAAPDVGRDVFEEFATKIMADGGKLTIYASAADKALFFSQWIWGRHRVGHISGSKPELIPGVDLIDITKAGMALFSLNHDVYAASPIVVADMRNILNDERPPDKRTKEFIPTTSPNGTYWVYTLFP
jgi:esterase/lipase superfamily enzyme